MVMEVLAHSDRGHVGLVVHPPHAAIADDGRIHVSRVKTGRRLDALLAQHDVVRARARRQLPVVGVARPWRGEDLALDFLHGGDVAFAHELQGQRLPDLDHQSRAPNDCMYSSLTLS